MIKRPPRTMELVACPFGRGPSAEIDRYSLQPLVDYVRLTQTTPSMTGEPPPEMFAVGSLPVFSASGVDVDILRWVHWSVRHSAAAAESPSLVYAMVEASAEEGGDPFTLATPEGIRAWHEYRHRVWRWATATKPTSVENNSYSPADLDQLFGPATS